MKDLRAITRRELLRLGANTAATVLVPNVLQAQDSVDWHRILFDHYKRRDSLPSHYNNVRIPAHNKANLYQVYQTENGKVFAWIEVGVNGIPSLSKQVVDNYCLVTRQGVILFIAPEQLKPMFSVIEELYRKEGVVQRLQFPESFPQPQRNALMFHPGKTLGDSYLEEKIGQAEPSDLPIELKRFAGYPISRLHRVDPKTARKGKESGYIVDVFTPPAIKAGGRTKNMVLKQYFGDDSRIPEYIITQTMVGLMGKTVMDSLKNLPVETNCIMKGRGMSPDPGPIYHTNITIDKYGRIERNALLKNFDEPIIVQGYNSY